MKRIALICFILLIASSAFGASSRILPTSYNEKTYGAAGAGRDYTSLATWESDTDNNLVTATKGEVLTCYDDASPYNDLVTLSGATTSAAYFRVIRAADGQKGTPTSGVRFEKSVSTAISIFKMSEKYAGVYDLAAKATSTVSELVLVASYEVTSGYVGGKFIGDLAYDTAASSAVADGFYFFGSGYAINCVSINCESASVYSGNFVITTGSTTYFYNCTAINGLNGFLRNAGTGYLKNCISQNNSTNINGAFTQTTNATSGVVFEADGYHLAATDVVARGHGTDLSADGTFAFNDDIDGQTRSGTWDIGCDEYIATSTAKPQVIIY